VRRTSNGAPKKQLVSNLGLECGKRASDGYTPIGQLIGAVFSKFARNASGHRGRDTQGLMDANEIVMHEIDRHHVRVVFSLL
jgi:hypothetical protein